MRARSTFGRSVDHKPEFADRLGFRLFIGMASAVIVLFWIAGGTLLYRAATDPEWLGRYYGQIASGFRQTFGEGCR